MNMLELAIRSRIPLVAVRTDDPLNVGLVLEHLCPSDVELQALAPPPTPKTLGAMRRTAALPADGVVYMIDDGTEYDAHRLYTEAAEKGACVLVVNPEPVHACMYDAGVLRVPDSVISEFLSEYADADAEHLALRTALRGLNYKEIVETTKLAMTAYGAFTADAIMRVRRQRASLASGLQAVDTEQAVYAPAEALSAWLAVDGVLFENGVSRRVRPRGLLFYGVPGTGKTSGAKYLADRMGVPLYALDVGSTMQKYVGESERTFAAALAQIEALAPCVLLLDEIEKAFSADDDSGVSRRVLGRLLWWLQEHDANVLTVMTTNDLEALPVELVRPGRVDCHVEFHPLQVEAGLRLATTVVQSLLPLLGDAANRNEVARELNLAVNRRYRVTETLTHAELTHIATTIVKRRLATRLLDKEESK